MELHHCAPSAAAVGEAAISGCRLRTLASFNGTNGQSPEGKLLDVNGTLYGMTAFGGPSHVGNLFSYTPGNSTVKDLYDFLAGSDGGYPGPSRLINVGGTIYGTTSEFGGPTFAGDGTLFSYTPTSSTEKTPAYFNFSNGAAPQGGLTDVNGILFGTTQFGGGANEGTIFSYSATTGIKQRASFTNGSLPLTGLTDVNGTLYGTTDAGGSANDGTLFSFDPTTNGINTLASFTGANGSNPVARLLDVGGTLYGTTAYGGSANDGTLFSFDPTAGLINTLVDFTDKNGRSPVSGLLDVNGTLYGTTPAGGSANGGTLFAYSLTSAPTNAPEPASLTLLGVGVAGLAFVRQRRG